MQILEQLKNNYLRIQAPCSVFNQCGGCLFQDLSYADELSVKQEWLGDLFKVKFSTLKIETVVASPHEYHYRHRLDLKMKRFKDGQIKMGFSSLDNRRMMEIEKCFIAREEISSFLPQLKIDAQKRLTEKHREANITVKSGDDKRIFWGGIGKRSLQMDEKDYLWTDINGRRIFYGLDTFFQANLFILPKLIETLRSLPFWNQEKIFFDLYGGVGLFGLSVSDIVKEVYLIEENIFSIKLAKYNSNYHQLKNFHVIEGRLEDKLMGVLENMPSHGHIAMIDPPRAGLSQEVIRFLNSIDHFKHLIYLSCNPESLMDNLVELTKDQWQIIKVIPFDFFPRTKHLETLVVLKRKD